MKSKKWILFLGMALCWLMLFTACGSPKAGDSSSTESGSGAAVTEAEAKSIALSHANISEADVTYISVEKDDNGRCFDVKFLADNIEYDYEINAQTGEVISYEYDKENAADPSAGNATNPSAGSSAGALLSEEEAKNIALNHANFSESDVTAIHVTLDKDDYHTAYEVEFHSGKTEYDYEIDANTGEILSCDIDK